MYTIDAANVEEAWALFHNMMRDPAPGLLRETAPRGLRTLEVSVPVATLYRQPEECVLLDPVRDCNPFFHLYEALWILAGHGDVERVAFYSGNIKQFSDDGATFHGAYGVRLRSYFGVDQLDALVELLRGDPASRRGVLQLWSAQDLNGRKKDHPCNTHVYAKIRDGRLNLTVCNRSNDAVWGCFGANAVQFSFLQQALAARLGVRVGQYHQVSDSLHVYLDGEPGAVWARCAAAPAPPLLSGFHYSDRDLIRLPLVQNADRFGEEVALITSQASGRVIPGWQLEELFLRDIAMPMCIAHQLYRDGDLLAALNELRTVQFRLGNEAWIVAGLAWLQRRAESRARQ